MFDNKCYWPRWKSPKGVNSTKYNIKKAYVEILKRNEPVTNMAKDGENYLFRIGDTRSTRIKYFVLSPQEKEK